MVGIERIELATHRLKVDCSTTELHSHKPVYLLVRYGSRLHLITHLDPITLPHIIEVFWLFFGP